jgi:hypothetical protein
LVAFGPLDHRNDQASLVVVFAIFAAVVAATIALRLAIWLPLYYRH